MKARKKGTNQPFEEVEYVQLINSYVITKADQMEFEKESGEASGIGYWEKLRHQAAIAAMQGIMDFFGSIDYNASTIAELAVKQADCLIEELKKSKL